MQLRSDERIIFTIMANFMKEIKEIFIKVTLLCFDILLFTYHVGQRLVLPGKKKKGNILSSLFDFFVGTIKKVSQFEHRFFRMTEILTQKYIRELVIVLASALLLLSSFEWVNKEMQAGNKAATQIEHLSQTATKKETDNKPNYLDSSLNNKKCSPSSVSFYYYAILPSFGKKYLLIHSLRI